MVLEIDPERRRISLGIKQLAKDPFDILAKNVGIGALVKGIIVEVIDKGLVVELNNKIRGFVPLTQLHKEDFNKTGEKYNAGEPINLKIVEINTKTRRIILSEKNAKKELESLEYKDYLTKEEADISNTEETEDQTDAKTKEETQDKTNITEDETQN
ncbi:unnamed protein product [marine sediment metagenome]|uniref:S1 motif domain-containing protein n=1 Tax=marine sediment metagenome TaxID=412755 RepID=X1FNB1_9ZZZZ